MKTDQNCPPSWPFFMRAMSVWLARPVGLCVSPCLKGAVLKLMVTSLTLTEGERLVVVDLVVQLQPEQEWEVVVAIDQGRRPQDHLCSCCVVILADVNV